MNEQYSFLVDTRFNTSIGPLEFIINDDVITQVNFKPGTRKKREAPFNELTKEITQQLKDYFNAKTFAFDLPMRFDGTDFQKSIWTHISNIPYGQTMTYSELATKAQSPNAFRAAGSACGKNPLPILIPCHRVLAQNNRLGGFGGGLEIKKTLLTLEGSLYQ